MWYEFRRKVLAENNADIKLHYRYAADTILCIDNLDVRVVNAAPSSFTVCYKRRGKLARRSLFPVCGKTSRYSVSRNMPRSQRQLSDRIRSISTERSRQTRRDGIRGRIFSRTCRKFLSPLLHLSHKICVFFINIKYMYYL